GADEGQGSQEGRGVDPVRQARRRASRRGRDGLRQPSTDVTNHFAGGPIVTVRVPTPAISHSSLSPAATAATPAGGPVMMMSPAAGATRSDSFSIPPGTVPIIFPRAPSCAHLPLPLS